MPFRYANETRDYELVQYWVKQKENLFIPNGRHGTQEVAYSWEIVAGKLS